MFRLNVLIAAWCLGSTSAPAFAGIAADSWPQLLHDNAHTSTSADAKLTVTSAPTLGVAWMSAMRSYDLGSPVAAKNVTLGHTIVYAGDERGDVMAFDAATGASVWGTSVGIGNFERSSPMVAADGSVWTATAGSSPAAVLKLDGATGAILCQLAVPFHINASIMLATPPGGVPTVYTASNHTTVSSGIELAANESDCSQRWKFDDWLTLSGAWATPAFGVDATGNGRVFVGTADPDSTMYALDALTGAALWNYSALNPPNGEFDIGAAATISPPGNNGFAHGVVYFPSKYGVMYALDMSTGKLIWQYSFTGDAKGEGGRSSAALSGTTLVYGMGNGIEALNAVTGKLIWHYVDPSGQEVVSSPAIAGPAGSQIVVCADATGLLTVLNLATGGVLYSYKTGNYITSSPAIVDGSIYIASADGFLYSFRPGGSNAAPPTTAITSPAQASKVPNPGSTITISGTATEAGGVGVSAVQLAVQRGGPNGPWLNASTGAWVTGAVNNIVRVASPGQPTSTWSFVLPVLGSGSSYQVTANAVAVGGQADRKGAQTSFSVGPTSQSPMIAVSQAIVPPQSTFTVSGGPFAANEIVDFSLQGGPIQKATASSTGAITKFTIIVPAAAQFGLSTLTATGETSRKASSAAVDITNVWSQGGFSALHTGYEPNDPIIGTTQESTSTGFLSSAWTLNTNAAVDSSPAVVAGVAYVANSVGALSAVDTYNGTPIWTYDIPSKAPIEGSPAVASDGSIVVSAADGSVYRVSSTGAPIGTVALDGVPTSPTLAGSAIYVGTDNGTVYALDEATGNERWSTALGAAISQPPTVDSAAGMVFVGDASGTVTVLDPASGRVISRLTGGSKEITTAPSVSSGVLLIGSADGDVRAFDETSFKLVWKYDVGSPVQALASTGSFVYAGAASGTIARLNEKNGAMLYREVLKGGIVGIGYCVGVAFAETTSGDFYALKDYDFGGVKLDYKTGGDLSTQPIVVDGTVYVGAENGAVYAFTTHGQAPDAVEHRFLAGRRATSKAATVWNRPLVSQHAAIPTQAFAPHGMRLFPMHIDRTEAPVVAEQNANVPVAKPSARVYLIGWAPVAIRAGAYVQRARTFVGPVAGATVDAAAYPRVLDDAAIQREIEREILANGWHAGPSAQFLVFTAESPVSARDYCSYHSAFDVVGSLALPAAYAVIPAGTSDRCGPFGAQIVRETGEMLADPYVRNR